ARLRKSRHAGSRPRRGRHAGRRARHAPGRRRVIAHALPADEEGGRVNPRVEKVKAMLAASPDDTFLLYALAMEYKKTDQRQSIELLRRVTLLDPLQSYAYFQLGQVHELAGDIEAARDAYRQGLAAADRAGDAHAKSEIAAALAIIE